MQYSPPTPPPPSTTASLFTHGCVSPFPSDIVSTRLHCRIRNFVHNYARACPRTHPVHIFARGSTCKYTGARARAQPTPAFLRAATRTALLRYGQTFVLVSRRMLKLSRLTFLLWRSTLISWERQIIFFFFSFWSFLVVLRRVYNVGARRVRTLCGNLLTCS